MLKDYLVIFIFWTAAPILTFVFNNQYSTQLLEKNLT